MIALEKYMAMFGLNLISSRTKIELPAVSCSISTLDCIWWTKKEKVKKQFGEDKPLKPQNIIESKKFEVVTPQVKISVAPEFSYLVETKVVEGRKYIMIPADEGVEVNGVSVKINE